MVLYGSLGMVAMSLEDRFFKSALPPLSNLLYVTGIFTDPQPESKRNRCLACLWSFLWLVFLFQSNVYTAYARTPLVNNFFDVLQNSDILVVELANALIRVSSLIVDTVVHVHLILTISSIFKLFLEVLESVDFDLNRPNLVRVHKISLNGLIYTFTLVC